MLSFSGCACAASCAGGSGCFCSGASACSVAVGCSAVCSLSCTFWISAICPSMELIISAAALRMVSSELFSSASSRPLLHPAT